MKLLKGNVKRIVSSLLVFALIFSIMMPLADITVEAAEEDAYTVNVRIEGKDSTIVKPKKLTIDSLDLSEYGIEKSFERLKPIHAIVKGLEVAGMDPKKKENLTIESSDFGIYISKVNGLEAAETSGWVFAVDNITASVGVADFDLKNEQNLVMYFQDTYIGNAYSWFERPTIAVEVNEEFEIKLNGSSFDETVATNGVIEDATILVDDKPYKEGGKLVRTDSNGIVTLKLKDEGNYHISAKKENAEGQDIISRPYTIVMVEEASQETVNTIKSIDSINKLNIDLNLSEEEVISKLPKTTKIVDSSDKKHSVNLKWTLDKYSSDKVGEYKATAIFELPKGVAQTDPETSLTVSTKIIVNKKSNESPVEIDKASEKIVEYYMKNNPGIPTGAWETYIGLWGLGHKIDKEYEWETIEPNPTFGEDIGDNDAITYSYALLAQGQDPSNIWGGRNLLAELAGQQRENGLFTDAGKHSFAMLLLDAAEEMGLDVGVWNDANRQRAIDALLERQNEDGTFGTFGDWTPMSLIALSKYKEQAEVKNAIDKALKFLESKQTTNGAFDYNKGFDKGENSNTLSIIIQSLVALDEDIVDPKGRWSKNGNTPVDALLKYQNDEGSFLWKLDSEHQIGFATKQAIVALSDVKNGTSTWHRLGKEIYPASVGEKDVEELVSNIEKLPKKDKINYDDKNIIMKSYNKYTSLPEEYKEKVTNSKKLLEAKAILDKIEKDINYINDGIWDLPGKPEDIRLKHKDQIINLLERYEALSDKDKKYVEYYSELIAAKEQIYKLEKDSVVVIPGVDKDGNNKGESDNTVNNNGEDVDIKDNSSKGSSSPKTGDKGIAIPIVLAILSALTLGVLSKKRKIM